LPLTPQVLIDNPCWRLVFEQIYACMESTMRDVAVVSGNWTPDGSRCDDTLIAAHYLTFTPPAPNGMLTTWKDNRTITFWNAGAECGTLKFADPRIITVSAGGQTAESQMRSSVAGGPDTRYARMTCPDGTTYVAHASEVDAIWNRMPLYNGIISSERTESMAMSPPGDRETLHCTFPP
jgi:hypothetical protein